MTAWRLIPLDRVALRLLVEERWLQDLRQFEGRDDDNIISELRGEGRSTGVVNITRSKVNTFVSKLYDMLFPTDDKNWGIKSTPVPEMDSEMTQLETDTGRLIEQSNAMAADPNQDPAQAEEMAADADMLAQRILEIEDLRKEATQKAELMSAEIEDNLVEGEYAIHCRRVLQDGTVSGSGILKGPIPLSQRIRKNWLQDDAGKYRLRHDPDANDRFVYQHVSYWNVFPDTTARRPGQTESWMERHIMRRRDIIEFAKQPGVDQDAIRMILDEGPNEVLPQHLVDLDTVSEEEQSTLGSNFYVMWEYRGPLEKEEMEALMSKTFTDDEKDEMDDGEIDPLTQMDAVVWFCQGHIVRVGINHLDDNQPIYSFFQIEESETRFWTVGIPYIMREQANTMNDAWRGMLDNAEFAAFPMVEVDTGVSTACGRG